MRLATVLLFCCVALCVSSVLGVRDEPAEEGSAISFSDPTPTESEPAPFDHNAGQQDENAQGGDDQNAVAPSESPSEAADEDSDEDVEELAAKSNQPELQHLARLAARARADKKHAKVQQKKASANIAKLRKKIKKLAKRHKIKKSKKHGKKKKSKKSRHGKKKHDKKKHGKKKKSKKHGKKRKHRRLDDDDKPHIPPVVPYYYSPCACRRASALRASFCRHARTASACKCACNRH